jgi:hypothetical protein
MEVSGQLHASAAIPRIIDLGTLCIGGRVGHKFRSGRCGVEKNPEPLPRMETRSPSVYGLDYAGFIKTYMYLFVCSGGYFECCNSLAR